MAGTALVVATPGSITQVAGDDAVMVEQSPPFVGQTGHGLTQHGVGKAQRPALAVVDDDETSALQGVDHHRDDAFDLVDVADAGSLAHPDPLAGIAVFAQHGPEFQTDAR